MTENFERYKLYRFFMILQSVKGNNIELKSMCPLKSDVFSALPILYNTLLLSFITISIIYV